MANQTACVWLSLKSREKLRSWNVLVFYRLVEIKMRAHNRMCGFLLMRQRSGNTPFKGICLGVETGVGSLDNVNVFNVFMLVVLVLIRAGGSELNCWLHSLHLSFVTKEVKSLFARRAPTESTTRWL